jgi:hypothetical protein
VAIDRVPPKRVQQIASRALEARKNLPKSKQGGLSPDEAREEGIKSGVSTARKLASGNPIGWDTISSMASFGRFLGMKQTAKVKLAIALWGGKTGIEWAQRKLKERDEE